MLIPTFGRAAKLGRCLERLARQQTGTLWFEVLVGVDGEDQQEAADAAHEMAARTAGSMRCQVCMFTHGGPGATRNRLAERASGRLLLMLNDDVLPEPDLVLRHAQAQAEWRTQRGGAALIVGAAPWVVPSDDTVIDRMVRETSMVFFYDRMDAAGRDRDRDWGFRHAWTLNLSVEKSVFAASGGFCERLDRPMYEDLEWAYRVCGGGGRGLKPAEAAAVVYRPEAAARHDHRVTASSYLERERTMGRAAWGLAEANPECAAAVFGRDVRSAEEIAYSRAFVARERHSADAARATFEALGRMPAGAVAGDHAPVLLRALYEQHLPVKRWEWRSGLLEEADRSPR